MRLFLIKSAFRRVPSAMNCAAITLHGEDQTHCENEESFDGKSAIRITLTLNWLSRISFILVLVVRRALWGIRGRGRCLDTVESIGALSEVAG